MPAATRRRHLPRSVLVAGAVAALALAWVGLTAMGQTSGDQTFATMPAVPAPADELAADLTAAAVADGPRRVATASRTGRAGDSVPPLDADATSEAEPFAEVDGLRLGLPHDAVELIAFHEATLPEALPLTPIGRLDTNDNPTKFAGGSEAERPRYRVLSSRGRPRPATSAVDIVVPAGATVVAPVTGTVVEAREYSLYGGTRDWRVVIEPAERPQLHVVMIHLHRPAVAVGDAVTAGRDPIGVARRLPFTSQVDYVTASSLPHVHLEVKAATSAKPVDPNAPAVDPEADGS